MSCRLCQRNKPLRSSHIIPEFVYANLYDSRHRFHVASTRGIQHRPMEQKGIREKLLCDVCEGQIAVYEKYASEALQGNKPIKIFDDGNLVRISGLDYEKFKLFQLSILWRASLSSHDLFSKVRLGPHEDRIRKMINGNDPGRSSDYPCAMFILFSKSGIQDDFIDQPTKIHIQGHIGYQFIFSGLMWIFCVSSHGNPPILRQVALNENGDLIAGKGPFEKLTRLESFAKQLHKEGRLPKPTE